MQGEGARDTLVPGTQNEQIDNIKGPAQRLNPGLRSLPSVCSGVAREVRDAGMSRTIAGGTYTAHAAAAGGSEECLSTQTMRVGHACECGHGAHGNPRAANAGVWRNYDTARSMVVGRSYKVGGVDGARWEEWGIAAAAPKPQHAHAVRVKLGIIHFTQVPYPARVQ